MTGIALTRYKIYIAQVLYRLVKLIGKPDRQMIQRKGIVYDIDLTEGIDLSIYLFGVFQSHLYNHLSSDHKPDVVVFDVGANIGDTTLRFAQQFPAGRVYAFEPTDYAWQKLIRNVALNPELAKRIETFKCFVSETDSEAPQLTAYASWKVNGKETDIHPIHGGIQKPATSTPSVTLDDFCRRRNIQKVDLIKIDTDGHEMAILKGARQTLKVSHPYIILEIGQYQLAEQKSTFQEFWQLLTECGYKHLVDSKKGTEITPDNYRKIIPDRTSIDVVASP